MIIFDGNHEIPSRGMKQSLEIIILNKKVLTQEQLGRNFQLVSSSLRNNPMDEFQRKKEEQIRPVLIEAGAALLDCQMLEYGVALLLFYLSRLGVIGLEVSKIKLILDDVEKKTAGQLIRMLKERITVSDEIEDALDAALNARNKIIHRFIVDNIECVLVPEDKAKMIKELKGLRSKVQKADKCLRPYINFFSQALDQVNLSEFEEEFRKSLE